MEIRLPLDESSEGDRCVSCRAGRGIVGAGRRRHHRGTETQKSEKMRAATARVRICFLPTFAVILCLCWWTFSYALRATISRCAEGT